MTAWKHAFHYLSPSVLPGQVRGFNEPFQAGTGPGTGKRWRFEYLPSNFFLLSPANVHYGRIVWMWTLGRTAGFISSNRFLWHSHPAYLVRATLDRTIARTQQESDMESVIGQQFGLPAWDDEKKYQRAMGLYKRYILSMDAIARLHSARSAFFIQPVPALHKPLSEQERRVTGDLSYGPLYERMPHDLLRMRGQGANIHSLLDLYAGETRTVYQDSIHARGDGPGYPMMAERIGALLAQSWSLKAKVKRAAY